jgi:hypothetical protein
MIRSSQNSSGLTVESRRDLQQEGEDRRPDGGSVGVSADHEAASLRPVDHAKKGFRLGVILTPFDYTLILDEYKMLGGPKCKTCTDSARQVLVRIFLLAVEWPPTLSA